MTKKIDKLELRWHGKDDWESPEPRLLIEKEVFQGEKKGLDDNILIFGDNLLGLKALERDYRGKVKCIYIDPPYNTKSLFKHYNDNLEHSVWLNMMKERLIIMRDLLREDGSIWISIDDRECHYLKVMCDEIFGRENFVANVIWERATNIKTDSKNLSYCHDHLLIYKKNINDGKLHFIERSKQQLKSYKYTDNNQKKYSLISLKKTGPNSRRADRPNLYYGVIAPDGSKVFPKNKNGQDSRWRWGKDKLQKDGDLIEWKHTKLGWSPYYKIYRENNLSQPSKTLWLTDEVGSNSESKRESKALNPDDPFPTPKPERLLQRIIHLATNPGDIVLDSFAGSGTTGAVAHKMGRKWIMIELGDHCHTHIVPRMEKVINGEDSGGITEQVDWKGGGGFRYCEMASSLLEMNRLGRWTISKKYNPAMLSEAVCMHAGYKYVPKQDPYWMHGYSTENDFIYVTAQTLTRAFLERLNEEMGKDRSLMIYCGAFKADGKEFENLTVRKIPKTILNKCTWGKDDYSLKVALTKEVEVANRKKRVPLPSGRGARAPMSVQGGGR